MEHCVYEFTHKTAENLEDIGTVFDKCLAFYKFTIKKTTYPSDGVCFFRAKKYGTLMTGACLLDVTFTKLDDYSTIHAKIYCHGKSKAQDKFHNKIINDIYNYCNEQLPEYTPVTEDAVFTDFKQVLEEKLRIALLEKNASNTTTPEPVFVTCKFCSSKFDKLTTISCPNCGAPT